MSPLVSMCRCGVSLAGPKLKDFRAAVDTDASIQARIADLRSEVEAYSKQFPTIGFEKGDMVYKH